MGTSQSTSGQEQAAVPTRPLRIALLKAGWYNPQMLAVCGCISTWVTATLATVERIFLVEAVCVMLPNLCDLAGTGYGIGLAE